MNTIVMVKEKARAYMPNAFDIIHFFNDSLSLEYVNTWYSL